MIDLRFPVRDRTLSSVLGYQIFAAISQVVPDLHGLDWALIVDRKAIGLRLAPEHIAIAATLATQALAVSGKPLHLGAPTILPLVRTHLLYSPIVIQKSDADPWGCDRVRLYAYLNDKLKRMGIAATITLMDRRSIQMRDQRLIGWECAAIANTYEDAIALQTQGLGTSRHFGAGTFVAGQIRANWAQ